jgi:hypothetical protein
MLRRLRFSVAPLVVFIAATLVSGLISKAFGLEAYSFIVYEAVCLGVTALALFLVWRQHYQRG